MPQDKGRELVFNLYLQGRKRRCEKQGTNSQTNFHLPACPWYDPSNKPALFAVQECELGGQEPMTTLHHGAPTSVLTLECFT